MSAAIAVLAIGLLIIAIFYPVIRFTPNIERPLPGPTWFDLLATSRTTRRADRRRR